MLLVDDSDRRLPGSKSVAVSGMAGVTPVGATGQRCGQVVAGHQCSPCVQDSRPKAIGFSFRRYAKCSMVSNEAAFYWARTGDVFIDLRMREQRTSICE